MRRLAAILGLLALATAACATADRPEGVVERC
jgi:hypothetical protein